MKIDKHNSKRFKKVKKMDYHGLIVRNLIIGTFILSVAFLSSKLIEKTSNHSVAPQQSASTQSDLSDNTISENDNSFTSKVTPSQSQVTNDKDNIATPSSAIVSETTSPKQEQVKKMIALSYDDGPAKTLTPELLKILEENDCTATFFVLGNRVKMYSDIIYQIYNTGNEIGNHSYDHSNFTKLTKEQALKQFNDTNDAIYQITNEYPTFFRPPYGAINNDIKNYVNCPFALWSIDSNDWRSISDDQVIENVMSELEDGKIILMHDIHKRTIEVSKILIPKIKELGYEIVSIKEMYEAKGIELENGCVYSKIKKN